MILATLCYLKHNNSTLMLHRTKRKDDIHAGKWNGLGGKLEHGEVAVRAPEVSQQVSQLERAIRQLCEDGQSTPDNLLELVTSFAKQQTAMGRIGTQYVTSPNKFFEGGMWQGPFPLPKAAQKVQPEKPERVRFIPPEYRDEEANNVPS